MYIYIYNLCFNSFNLKAIILVVVNLFTHDLD